MPSANDFIETQALMSTITGDQAGVDRVVSKLLLGEARSLLIHLDELTRTVQHHVVKLERIEFDEGEQNGSSESAVPSAVDKSDDPGNKTSPGARGARAEANQKTRDDDSHYKIRNVDTSMGNYNPSGADD